jgi:uncharacterized membrane protein (DUF373 family)
MSPRETADGPAGERTHLVARVGDAHLLLYLPLAALLIVAVVFVLVGTVTDLIEGSDSRPVADSAVFILERALLIFIIAELLYTLRLVDVGGRILVEPFLFIGLIAIVRRILVVTAEAEVTDRTKVVDFAIEVGALGAAALALAVSIRLLRGRATGEP